MNEEIVRELKLQTSILRAAFSDRLTEISESVKADPIQAAVIEILSNASGKVSAGDLMKSVLAAVNGSKSKTVQRRVTSLVEIGVVTKVGSTRWAEYESTGLIE